MISYNPKRQYKARCNIACLFSDQQGVRPLFSNFHLILTLISNVCVFTIIVKISPEPAIFWSRRFI